MDESVPPSLDGASCFLPSQKFPAKKEGWSASCGRGKGRLDIALASVRPSIRPPENEISVSRGTQIGKSIYWSGAIIATAAWMNPPPPFRPPASVPRDNFSSNPPTNFRRAKTHINPGSRRRLRGLGWGTQGCGVAAWSRLIKTSGIVAEIQTPSSSVGCDKKAREATEKFAEVAAAAGQEKGRDRDGHGSSGRLSFVPHVRRAARRRARAEK